MSIRARPSNAKQDAGSATTSSFHALLDGVAKGIAGLASLVFFLSLTALSLFFLLEDGPKIRAWGERHLGVPASDRHTITSRLLQSLRGYFFGVTLVAVFNAVVIGGGALLLGVPLAGTIAAVTFFGAFILFLGAWTAGAFAVLHRPWRRGHGCGDRDGRPPAARERLPQQMSSPSPMARRSASTRSRC